MAAANEKNREVRLKRRPKGLAVVEDFELVETAIPTPGPGQVLVRNIYLSIDPSMRNRLAGNRSYGGSYNLDETMPGRVVGEVVMSGNPAFQKGDHVTSMAGFREWYVSDGKGLEKADGKAAPLSAYAGALGQTGLTAWSGVVHANPIKPGQKVFVSAAAGAVGNIVCQIAKIKGAYVVGSTGTDEKCRRLENELGLDKAINYRRGNLKAQLREAFPDGIDYYFDNVGGDHLAAAMGNMALWGQLVICGVLQQYNSDDPLPFDGPLFELIAKRLTIQGYAVSSYFDRKAEFLSDMIGWHKEGKMIFAETIVDGIENAAKAFVDLYDGKNFGKMVVRIGPETI